MDDIRLLETDGDYLVLEANGGQKFRLLLDDSVRSAVRREQTQALDDLTMTPREIQDAVRIGTTIEELVKLSGATYEFVEKFAAPVIAELEHIIDSAKSVRVTTAGDRYSPTVQIEFGELIASRLAAAGATEIAWIARRHETGAWHVSVAYKLTGADALATWTFDQRALALSPENEAAVSLSANETIGSVPIPKLRPVDLAPADNATEVIPSTPAAFAHLVPKTEAPAVVEADAQIAPVVSITPIAKPEPVAEVKPVVAAEPAEPLSATADLLEALRRKRTEREESEAKAEPAAEVPVVEKPVVEKPAPAPAAPAAESTEAPVAAPAKKGRASMPSWDEIVFGTKADD